MKEKAVKEQKLFLQIEVIYNNLVPISKDHLSGITAQFK